MSRTLGKPLTHLGRAMSSESAAQTCEELVSSEKLMINKGHNEQKEDERVGSDGGVSSRDETKEGNGDRLSCGGRGGESVGRDGIHPKDTGEDDDDRETGDDHSDNNAMKSKRSRLAALLEVKRAMVDVRQAVGQHDAKIVALLKQTGKHSRVTSGHVATSLTQVKASVSDITSLCDKLRAVEDELPKSLWRFASSAADEGK